MCNFIPGEAVAIGPINELRELGEGLPGVLGPVQPLVSDPDGLGQKSELTQFGSVTLKTDPGLEIFAVSRISARLSNAIARKVAVVDLNHIIPLSANNPNHDSIPRLTPHAEREASGIRRILRSALPAFREGARYRVAVLDSGLIPNYMAHRNIEYFDYTAAGRLSPAAVQADPLGHGTRVVTVLDQILPAQVDLLVGRLPSDEGALTALTVAHALGDIVARAEPHVVNLSVTPRNDWFVCPHCRLRVPAPTFLSTFLSLIVRLSGQSSAGTVTVMAAGNKGQIPNSRWLTEDTETLIFAVAENQKGDRARYSGAPEGPHADLFSAGAFGGDDPEDPDAQGVFVDGSHGTSFAAPFVSAAVLLAKDFSAPPAQGFPTRIGQFTRSLISGARNGHSLRMMEMPNEE